MRPFVMISASTGNAKEDIAHTSALREWLHTRYEYSQGVGSYKGKTEISFQVFTTDVTLLRYKAGSMMQESILVVDSFGHARLVYTDGSPDIPLGIWHEVSKDTARAFEAWTLIGTTYYVAE